LRIATARDGGGEVGDRSAEEGQRTGLRYAELGEGVGLQLGALYQELGPQLLRTARRITRDPFAAEDVLQTAFEKALRRLADFRGEARPSTWLYRIVTNEALVWLRTERRRARRLVHEGESGQRDACDPVPLVPEVLQLRERAVQVRKALECLRVAEREVLLRIFMEDQTYAAIALQTATQNGAIKTRAFRARRRLRRLLGQTA
jgi:RNA polymerase sigma-70 factor (ECF subfamily)